MLVRRITAPIAGRIEGFADHQPARVGIGDEDIVHLPRVRSFAAGIDAHIGWSDERRIASTCCRGRHEDGFQGRRGRNGYGLTWRQIQRGRTLREDAAATDGPLPSVDRKDTLPFLKHDDGFFVRRDVVLPSAGCNPHADERQFPGAVSAALEQRLPPVGSRRSQQRIGQHRRPQNAALTLQLA